jgi:hypothetical protein
LTSHTYRLFAEAMRTRKQVICSYGGFRREICPIILGHTRGEEIALTYQFAGKSGSRLPKEGDWRCLAIAGVSAATLRDGPWRSGSRHGLAQTCVEEVEFDVNPASPYRPKRSLHDIPENKAPDRPRSSRRAR